MIQNDIVEFLINSENTPNWSAAMFDDLMSSPCAVKFYITMDAVAELIKCRIHGDLASRKALIEYFKYSKSVDMSWKYEIAQLFNQHHKKHIDANEMLDHLIYML